MLTPIIIAFPHVHNRPPYMFQSLYSVMGTICSAKWMIAPPISQQLECWHDSQVQYAGISLCNEFMQQS